MISRNGSESRLPHKALQVLLALVNAPGKRLSREALLNEVWPDSFPTDQVLSRTIADLRQALGEKAGEERYIRTLPKFGYALIASSGALVDDGHQRLNSKRARWVVTVLLVLMAIVVLIHRVVSTKPGLPHVAGGLTEAVPVTAAPGLEHQPRISPDGLWLIYASLAPNRNNWDLHRVFLASGQVLPVATGDNADEHGPALSPDGQRVAYVKRLGDECQVVTKPLGPGDSEFIDHCTNKFLTLVDWSQDGEWLAYTASENHDSENLRRIHRFNLETRQTTTVSRDVSRTGTDFYPRFSPDGASLAFLRGEPHPDHRTSLWVVDLKTGDERRLTPTPQQIGGMDWIDNNSLLVSWRSGGKIKSQRINSETGESRQLRLNEGIHPELSPDGQQLALVQLRRDLDLAALEADGSLTAIARSTADDFDGVFSPDGQWLVFISRRSGTDEIWLSATGSDAIRRLTRFEGLRIHRPSWRPDGRAVLVITSGHGKDQAWRINLIDGSVKALTTQASPASHLSETAAGELLYGCENDSAPMICLDAANGHRVIGTNLYRPQLSADGSDVYAVDDAGRLVILPLSAEKQPKQINETLWDSLPGKGRYGWSVNDDELLYLAAGTEGENSRLMRRNLDSGKTTMLLEIPMPLADVTLSVNSVTGAVLLTRYEQSNDDIILYPASTLNQ